MSASTPHSSQTSNSFPAPDEPVHKRLKCYKGLTTMTDAEIWGGQDPIIIESKRQQWRSAAYDHDKVALEILFDSLGRPNELVFRFEYKHDSPHHQAQYRRRLRTGDGARNLLNTARACNWQCGILIPTDALLYSPLAYSVA
ncbi:hypothetical protein FRC12_002599 [Ceratobasidium sp. 428]|nr:hypothetical protein FRC09_017606 [Ceratobasidium sp. 395]KAG8796220.1 hypothetical protein FRC12_002599 [Ceratobasidium sp. 428]